jgi:hypothetical protein
MTAARCGGSRASFAPAVGVTQTKEAIMGNRATVIFTDGKNRFSPAVYLHWNGGPESVYAFLEELDRRKQRADQDYECARFIQLIGQFFDQDRISSTSVGVANGPKSDSVDDLLKVPTDHGDNGFYVVNRTVEPMKVRRFREHLIDRATWKFTLIELPPEWVSAEHQAAEKHEYRKTFREVFAKITGDKPIEGM